MKTRGAEGTNERHDALRESQGSRVSSVQFPGTIAMQYGRENVEVPLKLTPGSGI